MNLKDQNLSAFEETLDEQAYLTDSQVECIRSQVEDKEESLEHQSEIIKAIDDYVRGNDRADERYLRLKELVDKAFSLFGSNLAYPEQVKLGFLPISIMVYFDMLLLVGVYKEDELSMNVQAHEIPGGSRNNEA